MKILRQGVKPNRYRWQGRYLCSSCRTIFDVTDEDADAILDWGEDQRDGYWIKIICPVCEEERDLLELAKTSEAHALDEKPPLHYPPGVR